MTQKDLFSELATGTARITAANMSLARALTTSTGGVLTFDYDTESGEWAVTGTSISNNIIRYKTGDNQSINFKLTEAYLESKGYTVDNPVSDNQLFDETTGMWTAKFQKDVTAMGIYADHISGPMIAQVTDATTFKILDVRSLILPTSVTVLGTSSIYMTSGLTNINLPYSITAVSGNSFTECLQLTGLTYPGTKSEWTGGKVNLDPDWAYDTDIYLVECSNGKIYVNTDSVKYTTTDGNLMTLAGNPFSGPVVDNFYDSTGGTIIVGKQGGPQLTVASNAFDGQETLKSIILPSNTGYIQSNAFRSCHNLTGITIPSMVTVINDYAFHYCTSLTSFTLPDTVGAVGTGILYDCTGITTPVYNNKIFVTIPKNTMGSYTVPDGIEKLAGGAFQWHTGLSSIILPSRLKHIGPEAFNNCNSLTTLTIPAAVEALGGSMFDGCSNLTILYVLNSESVPSIANTTLTGLPAGCNIYVPAEKVNDYRQAANWSVRAENIWPIS